MAVFTDKHTGKTYRVKGTIVTQYSGRAYFTGSILHLWGQLQSVVDFGNCEALNGWLEMMGFRG